MKQTLIERFQQLAGIKPLYEQLGPRMSNPRPTGPSNDTDYKVVNADTGKTIDFGLDKAKALEIAALAIEDNINAEVVKMKNVDDVGNLQGDDEDKLEKTQQGEKWEFYDLKFSWMTDLPEDIKVTVPNLYGSSLGEPTQKENKNFPPGTTNIGYTLQGWYDEFENKYPDALFYVDEENNTVEVADTREEGINLKWFEDVEASESKRFDNSSKPGSWRKSDNMGNKTDPWS